MIRRTFLMAALVLPVLSAATLARGAGQRHVSETIKLVPVAQSADYPSPGSSTLAAGIVSGAPNGRGAIIQSTRIIGHPSANTYTFSGTGTAFTARGTVASSVSGTATVQRDGSVKLSGRGRYIGGTDAYKHARGKFTFSGTIPPAKLGIPTPAVIHDSGTISY